MTACLVCLKPLTTEAEVHPACAESLFDTPQFPAIELDLSQLFTLAATKMAGKMSISGAQEKVSLTLSADRTQLEVAPTGGRYILKPETSRYASIPANEHLTMTLARLVAIDVPPCGIVRLRDAALAFIIRRFDRLADGTKLAVEDFCQLAGKPIRDKYEGSAELCIKLLRKFASEPLIEIQKLYRLLLFCWWVDNGDMHLKNFSILTTPEGIRRLSPAYDLVCTRLVIPDDSLAMPVGGRKTQLTRRTWLDFASYCGLPERAAKRMIFDQIEACDRAETLVRASLLDENSKERYLGFLKRNTEILSAPN